MRITEAYENRALIENQCKENKACEEEFELLLAAKTKFEFEKVLYWNFDWLLKKNILENWLPETMDDVTELRLINYTGKLPESMPNLKKLSCDNYTGKLPESMPNLKNLSCSFYTGKLPESMPNLKNLYCVKYTGKLPESMPNLQYLHCVNYTGKLPESLPANCIIYR